MHFNIPLLWRWQCQPQCTQGIRAATALPVVRTPFLQLVRLIQVLPERLFAPVHT